MLYARASPYKKRKERKKETKIMNEQFSKRASIIPVAAGNSVREGVIH